VGESAQRVARFSAALTEGLPVSCTAVSCTAVSCTAVSCTAVSCTAVSCTAVSCTAVNCGVELTNVFDPSFLQLLFELRKRLRLLQASLQGQPVVTWDVPILAHSRIQELW
jgi:hypothetical protein